MSISSAFRIATAACAISLVVALVALSFSSALTLPATILTALAGVVPLIVFIAGTVTKGSTWDEEVDAARLIEEIMSPTADHSTPASLAGLPSTEAGETRESHEGKPSSWDLLAWPAPGARDLELTPSK